MMPGATVTMAVQYDLWWLSIMMTMVAQYDTDYGDDLQYLWWCSMIADTTVTMVGPYDSTTVPTMVVRYDCTVAMVVYYSNSRRRSTMLTIGPTMGLLYMNRDLHPFQKERIHRLFSYLCFHRLCHLLRCSVRLEYLARPLLDDAQVLHHVRFRDALVTQHLFHRRVAPSPDVTKPCNTR